MCVVWQMPIHTPLHTLMHTELLGACNLICAMTRIGKLNQGEWFNPTRELANEGAFMGTHSQRKTTTLNK